jgi:hypothetical protein
MDMPSPWQGGVTATSGLATIDEDDVRDVMALHRRFGVPRPPEYAEG